MAFQAPVSPVISAPPSASDPTTAALAVSSNAAIGEDGEGPINGSSMISSLGQLKKKAPKLYGKMLESIGWAICSEMRDHQQRLKSLWKESR